MTDSLSQDELLKQFMKLSRFSYEPKTDKEWKSFYVVENVMRKHNDDVWEPWFLRNFVHKVVDRITNGVLRTLGIGKDSFSYSRDCKFHGLKRFFDDFVNNQKHLIPIGVYDFWPYKVEEPFLYYYINSEETNLKIDLNQLDNYKELSLADVLVLSMPTQKNLKDIDELDNLMVSNSFERTDFLLECAVSSSIQENYSSRLISHKTFNKMSSINGYLAEYFYSIVGEYLDEHKDNLKAKQNHWDFNNIVYDCANTVADKIKADLRAEPNLMSEHSKNLKNSLNELFDDKSGYGFDNICKYTLLLNETSCNYLINRLTTDIYVRCVGKTKGEDYLTNPRKSNITKLNDFHKIKHFLESTTVGDLVEYGIDLNHKNLKEGIPLLPLIAEFSKDIQIKFNKDIPKLSDLTRISVEIKN